MWFQKGAETKNPADSQFNIGLLYEWRDYDQQSYEAALQYYIKAAESNHADAANNVGWLYYREKDYTKAMDWYKRAIELGSTEAYSDMGLLYHHGLGVTRDYHQAKDLYQKSIQGSPHCGTALNRMGLLYQEGFGVDKKSHSTALDYFSKSAQLDADGTYISMGDMYRFGYGVTVSYEEASRWYCKAALDKRNVDGQFNLGMMQYEGQIGSDVDLNLALPWFKKSLRYGKKEAQRFIDLIEDKLAPPLIDVQCITSSDTKNISNTTSQQEKSPHDIRLEEAEKAAKAAEEKIAALMAQLELLQKSKSDNSTANATIVGPEVGNDSNVKDGDSKKHVACDKIVQKKEEAIKFFHIDDASMKNSTPIQEQKKGIKYFHV